jgi:hypothetical protein
MRAGATQCVEPAASAAVNLWLLPGWLAELRLPWQATAEAALVHVIGRLPGGCIAPFGFERQLWKIDEELFVEATGGHIGVLGEACRHYKQ